MSISFGKVILSGEHSAVYGEPAVAASVNLYLEATLHLIKPPAHLQFGEPAFIKNIFSLFSKKFLVQTDGVFITVAGNLSVGSGLGSSASAAYAIFQTLAEHFAITIADDEMIALIQESERFAHGHPSGLDAVTVVKQGVIVFQRTGENFAYRNILAPVVQSLPFFLLQSGRPKESTKKMIEVVREKSQTKDGKITIKKIGEVTKKVIAELEANTFTPEWLRENEALLEILDAVGEKARLMISAITKQGGFAKVTGAGGVSDGSGMILVYHPDQQKMASFFDTQEWMYHPVCLGMNSTEK